MEASDAEEKKDNDDSSIWHWFLVSICKVTETFHPCPFVDLQFEKLTCTTRACLTSILRVHYAGYIASEHDKSYNIARMGFWTFAEIAIGTVVSCSPVLPKFFQHFGPKVHEALSSRSRISDSPKTSDLRHPRSRSLLLRNGLGPKIIPRPDVSIESGTTLSYAERDTSRSWTAMEEENPTLRDHDGTLPIWGIEKYQGTRATSNTATLRDDLEAGLDGIPHGN